MKTVKLNEDLSLLTSIPEKTLNKVFNKSIYCVSSALVEGLQAGEDTIEVVTEAGSLLVQYKEGQLRYKFVPNAKLDRALSEAASTLKSPLEEALEDSVVRKFSELYRDLC